MFFRYWAPKMFTLHAYVQLHELEKFDIFEISYNRFIYAFILS